jgi:hypothetical protein
MLQVGGSFERCAEFEVVFWIVCEMGLLFGYECYVPLQDVHWKVLCS